MIEGENLKLKAQITYITVSSSDFVENFFPPEWIAVVNLSFFSSDVLENVKKDFNYLRYLMIKSASLQCSRTFGIE